MRAKQKFLAIIIWAALLPGVLPCVPSEAAKPAPAAEKTKTAALANAQVATPKQANAKPTPDYSQALLVLVGLELLALLYLIFTLQKLKRELANEREQHAQINRKLEYQALYDALTQLPNRRLFRDRLLQTIKMYHRSQTHFGVLMCDLDHFKEVNDTLGHDAGDMLLTEVTARLRKAIRDSDTLARLGGDEFALICPSVQDMPSASVICMRLINALREPVIIKGQSFNIGISIGIAICPEHASDDEMLMRRADMALYRAKEKRNTFVMFDPKIDRPKRKG